jgi:hypothetical protein
MVKPRFSKSGRDVNDFVSDSQERRTGPAIEERYIASGVGRRPRSLVTAT